MADDVRTLMAGGSVGIDVGSSNVKAVLLDGALNVAASTSRPLTWHRDGDVAEQDGDALWQAVTEVLGDLALDGGVEAFADVATIGVCGQYSSIVPVDADNRPVAPMRLYLDQRGTAHCLAIMERHPDAFMTWLERHPVPTVGGGLALGHILSFQHDSPDVHRATAAYLEPVDYVTTRLTGIRSATQGSVFASQLVDNRRLGVTGYDFDLLGMAGVDVSRLPRLVAPDSVVGTVRMDVAEATGLPPAAQVRAGMTDTQAAALATGVASGRRGATLPEGRLGIAIGTTSVVLASTSTMAADLDHEVLSMPGVSPDRWLVWGENGLAGRAVEHVMGRLVHADDALGRHDLGDYGSDSADGAFDGFDAALGTPALPRSPSPARDGAFDGFDAALAASPPGARGLIFLPWLSGSMSPQADSSVRGGFVGMSLDSERVDLVRAAAEGVAHNLRWLLGPVEAFTSEPCTELVLVGGASRSPGWCQIIADVLGRPVRTIADGGLAGARAAAAWAADPSSSEPSSSASSSSESSEWSSKSGSSSPESSESSSSEPASEPSDRSSSSESPAADHGPSPGNAWGESYRPDPDLESLYAAAQERFVATFEALRPLSLGSS